MGADFTTREEVQAVYRRRARWYDVTANLYYLAGFREQHYRRLAVAALAPAPGATVVEIGCGTGLNFALLRERVGDAGRIIGVDQSEAMLAQAARRVRRAGWVNVELVHAEAASYRFPDGVGGILSTFALTLEPEFDAVIARGARALAPGARWAVLDLKLPEGWPRLLAPLMIWLVSPFAVSRRLAGRHPWESIERHLASTSMRSLYLGFAYLCVGEAGGGAKAP